LFDAVFLWSLFKIEVAGVAFGLLPLGVLDVQTDNDHDPEECPDTHQVVRSRQVAFVFNSIKCFGSCGDWYRHAGLEGVNTVCAEVEVVELGVGLLLQH